MRTPYLNPKPWLFLTAIAMIWYSFDIHHSTVFGHELQNPNSDYLFASYPETSA